MIMPLPCKVSIDHRMEEGYAVESILGKRWSAKGKTEYLVKWLGYPVAEATWEPVKHLEYVHDMIRQYERHAEKAGELQKTHPIRKARTESRQCKSNEEKSEKSKPSSRPRGRPPKRKQPETISLDDSGESPEEDYSLIDSVSAVKISKAAEEVEEVEEGAEGAEGERAMEDSLAFSDVSDTIEVESLRFVNGVRYYQVRFPHAIKWVSNEQMRRYYPRELIAFYERFVNLA